MLTTMVGNGSDLMTLLTCLRQISNIYIAIITGRLHLNDVEIWAYHNMSVEL